MVHWLRLHAPNAGGLGLIPSQGTRSHMPQTKSLNAATKDFTCHTKTHHSQINKIWIPPPQKKIKHKK